MRLTLLPRIAVVACSVLFACSLSLAQGANPAAPPSTTQKEKKAAPAKSEDLIDLKSATKEQLMTLPGLGDA
jgi:DNA uptake protein ComE-like DNA-binding protein